MEFKITYPTPEHISGIVSFKVTTKNFQTGEINQESYFKENIATYHLDYAMRLDDKSEYAMVKTILRHLHDKLKEMLLNVEKMIDTGKILVKKNGEYEMEEINGNITIE